MFYYFSKMLPVGFEEAVHRTAEALKQEGFGSITEIDVKEAFQKKLGRISQLSHSRRMQSRASAGGA
jgi:uncharacterized protein (DUF302 family)